MIRVFIGHDKAETVAYHVLSHSIQSRSSIPVSITPISLSQLGLWMKRDRDPLQSNDFAFSRFLVPYLCNYEGYAVFMDCDMLCLGDIAELWNMESWSHTIKCVKHDHRPTDKTKYLGRPQTIYEKKNWSSVMLFNNARCRELTPGYVNTASGLELHQFKWLKDDSMIGELPKEWNHLVGYDEPNPNAKLAHFTTGGPYFMEYRGCEYGDEWWAEYKDMTHCEQRLTLHKSEVVEL